MPDDGWIAPSLLRPAAAPLAGLSAELSGTLNQRGDALAARMIAPGQRGVAHIGGLDLPALVPERFPALHGTVSGVTRTTVTLRGRPGNAPGWTARPGTRVLVCTHGQVRH